MVIKPSIISCFLALASIAAAAWSDDAVLAQRSWASLSTSQWREDLKYLAEDAPLKHRDLFHTMTEAQFQDEVQRFDAAMPSLSTDEIVVRFMQLAAMIQDAHSGIHRPDLALPSMPVRFVEFDDGVYVEAADPVHADMVGAKLVSVGSTGWKEAMAKLDTLVPDDAGNDGDKRVYAAHDYLNVPMILHGLGLTASAQRAIFTVEKGGKQRSYTVEASLPATYISGLDVVFDPIPAGWVSARASGADVPLAMAHPDKLYWFQPLPEHAAVYVDLRAMNNAQDQTLAGLAKELDDYLDSHDVQRIVVDVRDNSGGDNRLLRPLLVTLIRAKANHRGGLWVLISHKTHSAAQNFVNLMESYTDAIFVGEPTGDNVNMYGDYTYIELPNSHIPVALSTLWWQDKDPRDHRTATYPEIAVPRSFEQLTTGKDPALEIALTEAAPRPLEDLMEEAAAGGAGPLASAYKRFVDDPRHQYAADMEARLNRAGYALLGGGKAAQAVLVFQLCADTHPKSDNAYESLGEGLEAVGDKAAAISAYKQSLQINPSNRDASEAMKRLTASLPPR